MGLTRGGGGGGGGLGQWVTDRVGGGLDMGVRGVLLWGLMGDGGGGSWSVGLTWGGGGLGQWVTNRRGGVLVWG